MSTERVFTAATDWTVPVEFTVEPAADKADPMAAVRQRRSVFKQVEKHLQIVRMQLETDYRAHVADVHAAASAALEDGTNLRAGVHRVHLAKLPPPSEPEPGQDGEEHAP